MLCSVVVQQGLHPTEALEWLPAGHAKHQLINMRAAGRHASSLNLKAVCCARGASRAAAPLPCQPGSSTAGSWRARGMDRSSQGSAVAFRAVATVGSRHGDQAAPLQPPLTEGIGAGLRAGLAAQQAAAGAHTTALVSRGRASDTARAKRWGRSGRRARPAPHLATRASSMKATPRRMTTTATSGTRGSASSGGGGGTV